MTSEAAGGLPEYSFRTSSDKSLPGHQIRLMKASPRMDLLLLAADNGDVLLYRWGWERVWLVAKPRDLRDCPAADGDKDSDCCQPVTCIDWRPDGQVALVAYSDGRIRHLSLEDGSVLHEDHVTRPDDKSRSDCEELDTDLDEGPVLCSHWAVLANRQFNEPWTRARDALPVFSDIFGNGGGSSTAGIVDWTASRRIERQLSMLALTTRRRLHLLAYGICRLCRVSLDELSMNASRIWQSGLYRPVSVMLSDNLTCVSLLARLSNKVENNEEAGGSPQSMLLQCDTGLAAAGRYERVRQVALTVVQLTQLTAAVRRCLKDMRECWEDSVHELDQKFADYSKDRDEYALAMGEPDWQLRTDLMALLLTGHCHAKFREFLCEGLSRAGLVRIGRGIEASLCSVQRHNARQLQTLLFAAIFHLSELADLAATGVGEFGDDADDELGERRFQAGEDAEESEIVVDDEEKEDGGLGRLRLGELSRRRAVDALSYAGTALAKSLELGAVIDRTRDSLRAFCEWLFVQILRLSKEPVPRSLQQTTAQRRRLVTEFIRHQLAEGDGQRRFRLELVGQYLAEAPLAAVPDCPTVWQQVLERHLKRQREMEEVTEAGGTRRSTPSCLLVQPDKAASMAQCLNRLCDMVASGCRLAEPRRLRLLTPALPLPGCRPLAQGYMGKQGQYHALLLDPSLNSCLLVRQQMAGQSFADASWYGLRFSFRSPNGAEFADACQLDSNQFACLLVEAASETTSLFVLPLAVFKDADWSPLSSPEAALKLSSIDLAERLSERLRWENLPGRGIAVAAERRLLMSLLFSCRRRLCVCLLEPYCEDDDDEEADGEGKKAVVRLKLPSLH